MFVEDVAGRLLLTCVVEDVVVLLLLTCVVEDVAERLLLTCVVEDVVGRLLRLVCCAGFAFPTAFFFPPKHFRIDCRDEDACCCDEAGARAWRRCGADEERWMLPLVCSESGWRRDLAGGRLDHQVRQRGVERVGTGRRDAEHEEGRHLHGQAPEEPPASQDRHRGPREAKHPVHGL